ncbi:EamA/RhaT family transporter [Kitasatospora cathayae]|uniref:EamA/RhaT family transporter n=1 Tax=Kitasatospora cathayae TaxID=3004092 RepID=A0ABY7Q6F4_9ACTN|nr:EamA/RhaT family transporter [Kitasatospora sp. HUAS 3-15]WBP88229.1 EamA/RhaT family transporter [Kitasatospora sp. HUAS 3-15]
MSEQPPTPAPKPAGVPEPEPIRFFGTSWLDRDNGYWPRRLGVSTGALVATAAAVLVLRFGVEGVALSDSGGFLNGLLTAAIAVCSLMSVRRTWKVLTEGKDQLTGWMAEDKSLGAVWLIGGAGSLAAYFARSLVEAPGEAVRRAAYERAVEQHAKRRAGRSGRPGGKRKR